MCQWTRAAALCSVAAIVLTRAAGKRTDKGRGFMEGERVTYWQRWVRQPADDLAAQSHFQIHMWSGIAIGLYVLLVSVTGSVLVYRNELYRATMPGD